jgi:hypothetical protein
MNKDILRRLEQLKLKNEEPVKIYDLFQLPDGSEVKIRFNGSSADEKRNQWITEHDAKLIDIIIEVCER